jgi:hypothetical protein
MGDRHSGMSMGGRPTRRSGMSGHGMGGSGMAGPSMGGKSFELSPISGCRGMICDV